MRIYIDKDADGEYEVGIIGTTGSPRVGRGKSMSKAITDFFRIYQKELSIESITLNEAAMKDEMKRRKKELNKR